MKELNVEIKDLFVNDELESATIEWSIPNKNNEINKEDK